MLHSCRQPLCNNIIWCQMERIFGSTIPTQQTRCAPYPLQKAAM